MADSSDLSRRFDAARLLWLWEEHERPAAIHRLDAVLRDAAREVEYDAAVAEWFAPRCGTG
jgi:hypothetical protein